MPKMKTISGAKKRLKKTGSGKVKRAKTNRRHILTSKPNKNKRSLRMPAMVDQADMKSVRQMMPYG